MARSYHNIDKSAFRKGEYVGYATVDGKQTVWHIARDGRDGWKAVARDGDRAMVYDKTGIYQLVGGNLGHISGKLAGLNDMVHL